MHLASQHHGNKKPKQTPAGGVAVGGTDHETTLKTDHNCRAHVDIDRDASGPTLKIDQNWGIDFFNFIIELYRPPEDWISQLGCLQSLSGPNKMVYGHERDHTSALILCLLAIRHQEKIIKLRRLDTKSDGNLLRKFCLSFAGHSFYAGVP